MGCQGSKSATTGGKFTDKDKKLVRETWDEFSKDDVVECGLPMFLKLFEDENAKMLFSFAKDEDIKSPEVMENAHLRSHVKRVFEIFENAVQNMDNLESIESSLKTLGETHSNVGVSIKYLEPLGNALMYALKLKLEDKFTKEAKEAWSHFYKAVAASMSQGMDSNIK